MKKILLFLFFFTPLATAQDNADLYSFPSLVYQKRFHNLTHQLRCLVCQNQTLADSDAPLAQDMRQQIFSMINKGATDAQINEFLVKRYGEFISYQPPFNRSTFFLWITPAFLLMVCGIFLLLRHRS
jgi:cytochrome c-type biogenesis protein CcmH